MQEAALSPRYPVGTRPHRCAAGEAQDEDGFLQHARRDPRRHAEALAGDHARRAAAAAGPGFASADRPCDVEQELALEDISRTSNKAALLAFPGDRRAGLHPRLEFAGLQDDRRRHAEVRRPVRLAEAREISGALWALGERREAGRWNDAGALFISPARAFRSRREKLGGKARALGIGCIVLRLVKTWQPLRLRGSPAVPTLSAHGRRRQLDGDRGCPGDDDLPFDHVPAGAHQPLRRDLQVACTIRGALAASTGRGAAHRDVGEVDGQVNANNVSAGIYGDAVQAFWLPRRRSCAPCSSSPGGARPARRRRRFTTSSTTRTQAHVRPCCRPATCTRRAIRRSPAMALFQPPRRRRRSPAGRGVPHAAGRAWTSSAGERALNRCPGLDRRGHPLHLPCVAHRPGTWVRM